MIKTSIILPCYNVESFLPRAIESVLNQSFKDFELLVIIDGSPDSSKQIAEEYALKDTRIKVFEKENGGLSDARNYGLSKAKGEFIYFMDSDDWIEPDLLEDNLIIIEQENLDFIIFGYIQDDENEHQQVIHSKEILPLVNVWKKNDPKLKIDQHHLGLLGYAWNKIYKKSFLDQHDFKFEKGISLVEDILFNAPIYTISEKIRFNQKAYYHYLNRPIATLIKTFHPNHLLLKKRKHLLLEDFFDSWNIPRRKEILAKNFIDGFRGSIHSLFAYKNQLTPKEQRIYLKKMYRDQITRSLINHYIPGSQKEKIHKFLVKHQLIFTTYIFAKLLK